MAEFFPTPNESFSKGATQSRMRIARVRLLPYHPSAYNGTVSLNGNVLAHPSGERTTDLGLAEARKAVSVPAFDASPHSQKMAVPPYARHRSTLATLVRQYVLLLRVTLAEYRSSWILYVIGGLLIPMSFAFVITAVGGASNRASAVYLLGGNMALSIATGPATFLISKLGWARQSHDFHYWIALPVPKLLLVLAIVSVALVFALPGLLGVYVLGSLLLGLPFSASAWLILPLIPLGVLPLTGLGALLGLSAPNGQIAQVFGNMWILLVGVLSPVMLPLSALPVPLRILAQVLPTTYAADAFRAVLGGYQGAHLALDLILLPLFSAVLLTLTYVRLDWRNT